MKPWFLLLVLLTPSLSFACDQSPMVIRNVSVWSPDGISSKKDVYVADGHIQSIEPTSSSRPKAIRIIEGRGATLLPGFIDSHLHFTYEGRRPARPTDGPWGSAEITGKQLLASGVTSGRVHLISLNDAQMVKDSNSPCAALPRLQSAGPAFIPNTSDGYGAPVWTVKSPADAADRVMREKNAGFDWIAIHEAHNFKPRELQAIVGTARAQGMRVLGSGYTLADLESSLALFPDTIDYISVSPEPEYPEKLLLQAREQKDLIWVARLGVHSRVNEIMKKPSMLDNPLYYEFVPQEEIPAMKEAAKKIILDPQTVHAKRMTNAYPSIKRKFQQLRESGILLAAGTDAGSPGHFHRDAIWWELNAWVEMGATPKEALMTVTVNGAKVLGLNDVGVLKPGARADFILYSGDVENGEFNPKGVKYVSKSGVIVYKSGVKSAK